MEFDPSILHEVEMCDGCPLAGRDFVPGEGPRGCRAMAVGASPGPFDAKVGIPFSGPAGSMVREVLDALSVRAFYTNVVHRPLDREPRHEECWKCGNHLIRELALVQPAVVITFGSVATRFFLGAQHSLSALRGLPIPVQRYGWRGLVIPVYDPGFVKRRGGLLGAIGAEWVDDLEDVKRHAR